MVNVKSKSVAMAHIDLDRLDRCVKVREYKSAARALRWSSERPPCAIWEDRCVSKDWADNKVSELNLVLNSYKKMVDGLEKQVSELKRARMAQWVVIDALSLELKRVKEDKAPVRTRYNLRKRTRAGVV